MTDTHLAASETAALEPYVHQWNENSSEPLTAAQLERIADAGSRRGVDVIETIRSGSRWITVTQYTDEGSTPPLYVWTPHDDHGETEVTAARTVYSSHHDARSAALTWLHK